MKYRLFQAQPVARPTVSHRSRPRSIGITALPLALSALLSLGLALDTASAAAKPKAKTRAAKVTPTSPPDSAQVPPDKVGSDKVGSEKVGSEKVGADSTGADAAAADAAPAAVPGKPAGDGAVNAVA